MANILLADDDGAVRELVARALTSEGHTVHVTQDGSEALEKIAAGPGAYQLLVTDVDMPQMDGITLVQEALKLSPQLSVVFMSGFSDQLDRAHSLGAVRVSSISKPFTLEQIRQVVRLALV